jgi:2-iminobutanoate/2-iminopropanoate deaminase
MAKIKLEPVSYPVPKDPPRNVAGTKRGPFVFTSGIVARDREGGTVGIGDIRAQTRQTLLNLETILRDGGATLADVMKVNVFITNFDNFAGMNDAYSQFFRGDLPARTTVQAQLANPEWLVEIEAVAIVQD